MWEDKNYFRWVNQFSPFHGELVGFSHCDSTYYQARKESEVTVLEYVTKGTGTLKVNGTTFHPQAGDVYLLPLYSNHIYFTNDNDPWEKYFINIRGNLPSVLIESYHLQLKYVFQNSNTNDLFLEMYNCAKSDIDDQLRQEIFASLVHRIFIRLQRSFDNTLEVNDATIIKNIIDNAPNKIYSVQELADKIGRSKDFVIKAFKRMYGITPHVYINEKKHEIAKMMLLETNLPIEQIAASLGFQSSEHFSTQFKKFAQLSPRTFRELTRKK